MVVLLLESLVAASPAGALVEGAGVLLMIVVLLLPEGVAGRGGAELEAGGVFTVTLVRVEDEAGGAAAGAPGTTTVVGAVVDGTSRIVSFVTCVGDVTTMGVSGWRVA